MTVTTPIVNYKSIKVKNSAGEDVNIVLNSDSQTASVSFKAPCNKIYITLQPNNCSLSYYEARVTTPSAQRGIGLGALAYSTWNIESNKDKAIEIPIGASVFPGANPDGSYIVSLYAKSATDGSWDVEELLFVADSENPDWLQATTSASEDILVYTTEEAPSSN